MNTPTVNWEALEFSCVHQADLLPKPDPEVDEWFQKANALYKGGIKMRNENLLRESFELLLKAAEKGHVKAMNNVVVRSLDREDEGKAVEWTKKLIERNIGMGYYHMGHFLEQGIGVKQDRKAALTYFRKAADLGNAQGQLVVGKKIKAASYDLSEPEKNKVRAIGLAMMKCSLAQGNKEAGYELAKHYQIQANNIPEALKAFQAAGKLGHNQSLFELSELFSRDADRYGLAKDEARAACYERLWRESKADKTKTFPDIDRICPLPPKPMPKVSN
ncbi:MAG: sel1 repeat family protein [Azoarcus sp.]|jgi:TPR repeat protein|nr:sel1 repeat family protein [Azoarcus sp.]